MVVEHLCSILGYKHDAMLMDQYYIVYNFHDGFNKQNNVGQGWNKTIIDCCPLSKKGQTTCDKNLKTVLTVKNHQGKIT